MFPFLIGTVRTLLSVEWQRLSGLVSIPHRYGKNFLSLRANSNSTCVSIPHRYGKNTKETALKKSPYIEFPFLIGTVRTEDKFKYEMKNSKFPFLIGTVRTKYPEQWGKRDNGFHSS